MILSSWLKKLARYLVLLGISEIDFLFWHLKIAPGVVACEIPEVVYRQLEVIGQHHNANVDWVLRHFMEFGIGISDDLEVPGTQLMVRETIDGEIGEREIILFEKPDK